MALAPDSNPNLLEGERGVWDPGEPSEHEDCDEAERVEDDAG